MPSGFGSFGVEKAKDVVAGFTHWLSAVNVVGVLIDSSGPLVATTVKVDSSNDANSSSLSVEEQHCGRLSVDLAVAVPACVLFLPTPLGLTSKPIPSTFFLLFVLSFDRFTPDFLSQVIWLVNRYSAHLYPYTFTQKKLQIL